MRASASARQAPSTDSIADWLRLLRAFAVSFIIAGTPIALQLVGQPIALLFCVAAAVVAGSMLKQDIPIIVIVPNVFQNTFASLVSPKLVDFSEIEMMKSYSFVTTIVCWMIVIIGFLRNRSQYSPFVRRLIYASVGLLAIVAIYFALGLTLNPRNAAVYLRNIGLPILLFQTFLLVGAKHRAPTLRMCLILLGLVAACCYVELLALDFWLTITNGWRYLTLFTEKRLVDVNDINAAAAQGVVVTSVLDYSKSDLFNTTLLSWLRIEVQRLQGPNFNTISLGYLLAHLISLMALHRHRFVALLAVPLLIATSAKGPLVLFLTSVVFALLTRRWKSNVMVYGLLAFLAAYATLVFRAGLASGDYHVLGLLGGVSGLLQWPIGHTLGEGGNLSLPDFGALNWSAFQQAGSADVAVESAFGVLVFQLGVASAAWFAFYLWIALIGWRLFKYTGAPALASLSCGILVCLVNGLFQEDAYFVPFSLAFLMGFVGLAFGAVDRAMVAEPYRTEAADRPMGRRGHVLEQASIA